jgi:hypothetical protein
MIVSEQKIESINTVSGKIERCECLNWCRDGRLNSNHHINCSHFINEHNELKQQSQADKLTIEKMTKAITYVLDVFDKHAEHNKTSCGMDDAREGLRQTLADSGVKG